MAGATGLFEHHDDPSKGRQMGHGVNRQYVGSGKTDRFGEHSLRVAPDAVVGGVFKRRLKASGVR